MILHMYNSLLHICHMEKIPPNEFLDSYTYIVYQRSFSQVINACSHTLIHGNHRKGNNTTEPLYLAIDYNVILLMLLYNWLSKLTHT